jgi:hypothetical protein
VSVALQLCCWVNILEKRLFSAPYEGKDCHEKMTHFLPRLSDFLDNPNAHSSDWEAEYEEVVTLDICSFGCWLKLPNGCPFPFFLGGGGPDRWIDGETWWQPDGQSNLMHSDGLTDRKEIGNPWLQRL